MLKSKGLMTGLHRDSELMIQVSNQCCKSSC